MNTATLQLVKVSRNANIMECLEGHIWMLMRFVWTFGMLLQTPDLSSLVYTDSYLGQ